MTLSEIMAIHPGPWRHQARGGNVQVIDAKGKQVQLFTILDFVTSATAQLTPKPKTTAA